jgi:hypothetical protein
VRLVVIEGEFDQAANGLDRRMPIQVQFALDAADVSVGLFQNRQVEPLLAAEGWLMPASTRSATNR